MTPLEFLWLTLALTFAIAAGWRIVVRRRQRTLQTLARELGLHFCSTDRFRLASKIVADFPCTGAADLKVSDVIYGHGNGMYRYIFMAEYTAGVVHTKHRRRCVVAFSEPKHLDAAVPFSPRVIVAPGDSSLVDQYEFGAGQLNIHRAGFSASQAS